MVKVNFIGYARSNITTRNGELLDGYNLYFLDNLRKGTGQYGCSKFVKDERLKELGGLPELNIPYEVDFDRWGNFSDMVPLEE